MKDPDRMFSVPLGSLSPEQPAPFPLFVFLRQNGRMVPVRLAGDPLGAELYGRLRSEQHTELWVPKEFGPAVEAYLDYAKETAEGRAEPAPEPVAEPEPAADVLAAEPAPALDPASAEAEAEPAAVPTASLSPLELLKRLPSADAEALRPVAQRLRESADLFLELAEGPLYSSALALRESQDPLEHGVFLGSLAAALAVEAGLTGEDWIPDLIVAALFHDIGMTSLPFKYTWKDRAGWTDAERHAYEGHVDEAVRLLRLGEPAVPETVIRFVSEHHERPDGSGFPLGLKGRQLHRGSVLLGVADRIDRLLWGEESGKPVPPTEAFMLVAASPEQRGAPEFLERILKVH